MTRKKRAKKARAMMNHRPMKVARHQTRAVPEGKELALMKKLTNFQMKKVIRRIINKAMDQAYLNNHDFKNIKKCDDMEITSYKF